jgi:hypothetical protein
MKSVDLKSFSICNPSARLLCRTLAVSALMLGLSAIPASAEDNGCSNATLKGDYAYAVSGSATIPPAGFVAILGRIALDGKGSFTGSVNGSIAGIVILKDVAVTGSYRIASDCTGTLTTDYPAFTLIGALCLSRVQEAKGGPISSRPTRRLLEQGQSAP